MAGIETDLASATAAFGGRTVLSVRAGAAGAFELALASDVRLTNTVSESVESLVGAAGVTGLSLDLGSARGTTQSGVQSLWTRPDASGLARSAPFDAGQQLQAELGYGFDGPKGCGRLWVPFLGAEAGDGGVQALRMGVKLTSGPNLEAGLEFGRRDNGRKMPEYAIRLNGSLRW